MKLILVGMSVAVILGSAAAQYEWEQFHDSYEEQHEPEIGESAKDSGYGKRVNSHTQIQSNAAVARKAETSTLQRGSSVGLEGGSTQSSNVGRKSGGFQKSGREFHTHRNDRFDHEGRREAEKHRGE